jgi:hypothetical protein
VGSDRNAVSPRGLGGFEATDLLGETRGRSSGLGSAISEAVSVGGFDDEASGGHGGEAFVESGGADAAGCAQFGEWPQFIPLGESGRDALIHGRRLGTAIRLMTRLVDGFKGKSVVALGQFQGDTGHSGGGAMLTGRRARPRSRNDPAL